MAGHVFISYSRKDRRYVERLARYLADAGVLVWWDDEVESGEPFARRIQKAIDGCIAFVPVLTPDFVTSPYAMDELSRAKRLPKPIRPLLYAMCDRPLEVEALHHEDVTDGRLPDQRFVAGLLALQAQAAQRESVEGGLAITIVQYADLTGTGFRRQEMGAEPADQKFWTAAQELLRTDVAQPPQQLRTTASHPVWGLRQVRMGGESWWCFSAQGRGGRFGVAGTCRFGFVPDNVSPADAWRAGMVQVAAGDPVFAPDPDIDVLAGVTAVLAGLALGRPAVPIPGSPSNAAVLIERLLPILPPRVVSDRTWSTCLLQPYDPRRKAVAAAGWPKDFRSAASGLAAQINRPLGTPASPNDVAQKLGPRTAAALARVARAASFPDRDALRLSRTPSTMQEMLVLVDREYGAVGDEPGQPHPGGWWQRRMRRPSNESTVDSDLLVRFGHSCPVCGSRLGGPTPIDPRTGRFAVGPPLRLWVGVADSTQHSPWQVSIVEGNYPPATSMKPAFSGQEVNYVYLLCGGGHIFPEVGPIIDARPGEHVEDRKHIDVWNMVGAIGVPASGKTYLLVRTLHQSLVNEHSFPFHQDEGRTKVRDLSPLEKLPLSLRRDWYGETRASGLPMPATGIHTRDPASVTPAAILESALPGSLSAVQDLIKKTVLNGAQRAEGWGTGIRQPLVLRADHRGRHSWTGVADLPGELFSGSAENLRESARLRAYDAMVWVIDPAVAANALTWLDQQPDRSDPDASVLDGSLRPGSTALAGPAIVRANREQIQHDIGRQLSLVDDDRGGTLELLVTVTKCDLVHAALRKATLSTLAELGEDGVVHRGVTAYLLFHATRFAQHRTHTDATCAEILSHLHAGPSAQQSIREERASHLAEGLLRHYSEPSAFWNLVHVGAAEQISIPERGMNRRHWTIEVPGIGSHIDDSTLPGHFRQILIRDLVMSAVGCGVAHGLGNDTTLSAILRKRELHVRFFLCSALATVPVARPDQRATVGLTRELAPREPGTYFPKVAERSAALTQLLLAMLAKVRG